MPVQNQSRSHPKAFYPRFRGFFLSCPREPARSFIQVPSVPEPTRSGTAVRPAPMPAIQFPVLAPSSANAGVAHGPAAAPPSSRGLMDSTIGPSCAVRQGVVPKIAAPIQRLPALFGCGRAHRWPDKQPAPQVFKNSALVMIQPGPRHRKPCQACFRSRPASFGTRPTVDMALFLRIRSGFIAANSSQGGRVAGTSGAESGLCASRHTNTSMPRSRRQNPARP